MYELASSLPDPTDPYVRLGQAEALVRSYCDWHIAPSRTETVVARSTSRGYMRDYYDSTVSHFYSPSVLVLPTLHLTAVTSIVVDGLTLDPSMYTWSSRGYITRLVGHWVSNSDVLVTVTHGFEIVPPEVEAVVQAVAQRAFNNPNSVVREQAGPFSVFYSQVGGRIEAPALALMDAEKSILDRYRLPPLA